MSARRVVTLPPGCVGAAAVAHAAEARRLGAQLLELRTDLHPASALDVQGLRTQLPLLVSHRGVPLPAPWVAAAEWVDVDVSAAADASSLTPGGASAGGGLLLSHHASVALLPEEAERLWRSVPLGEARHLKHVEPLGQVEDGWRLLETRKRLRALAPHAQVTVLAMGPYALPFRCVLAVENAFDYVATSAQWMAAPGQRLLKDATREARAEATGVARPNTTERLAILGHRISESASPRIHPQPFDRLDLPAGAPLKELLSVLHGRYRGFAVTSPFKHEAARAVGADVEAINTLYRRGDRYAWGNTDIAGARATLEALGSGTGPLTALGGGGATFALQEAAKAAGRSLSIRTREALRGEKRLRGTFLWTWPASVDAAPEGLSFEGSRVAVIAYGRPGRRVAEKIRAMGGEPVHLGMRWFLAQAREQRRLWEQAT